MKTKDIGMTLLESVNQGLTPDQKKIVEGIVNEFRPLYEATLTPQQIANIFGTVEKSGGRTAVGKGVDVAKKANEIIKHLCAELNATETEYPDTNLKLIFKSVSE